MAPQPMCSFVQESLQCHNNRTKLCLWPDPPQHSVPCSLHTLPACSLRLPTWKLLPTRKQWVSLCFIFTFPRLTHSFAYASLPISGLQAYIRELMSMAITPLESCRQLCGPDITVKVTVAVLRKFTAEYRKFSQYSGRELRQRLHSMLGKL